ncbi:hypothetical protein MOMA_03185 [Moraxella macacae 0408225]|uniref:Uncharacterized protein n=1 Tax=Moraxella macacae 0408225 TaxID=1230338 RepID=L2FA76_9GAMM|nr:hypothetical protein MOMA_03185 [Moraxella macacae 0408225]
MFDKSCLDRSFVEKNRLHKNTYTSIANFFTFNKNPIHATKFWYILYIIIKTFFIKKGFNSQIKTFLGIQN